MPTNNVVKVTLKIRNDAAANWVNNNPILAQGEFGLENNSFLLKVGDGVTHWNNLRYLNKIDPQYLVQNSDGTITFSQSFQTLLNNAITANGGTITGKLEITSAPTGNNDAVNKLYVDEAIANAGHLKREIVYELPLVSEADENTIYMILDNNIQGSDRYKEYMKIGNAIVQVGDTSIDLKHLVTGTVTPGNLITVDNTGALVDSGITGTNVSQLEVATNLRLGGVKSSTNDNEIAVNNSGFMTLNRVSTSLLYVPDGDALILDGGASTGGVVSGE